MKSVKTIGLVLIFIGMLSVCYSQTKEDKTKAYEMAGEAIKLMDAGDYDKSIDMLTECEALDPKNYIYPYEIGYAYLFKKDYKKATKIFKKVVNYEGCTDECYTMLGNAYDMNSQSDKAIDAYHEGLKRFPNSGRLYFELGVAFEGQKEYNKALDSYENGIAVLPSYASNYHTVSFLFGAYTDEKIWGLMYGELFANIERGSKKTEEVSRLLHNVYTTSINIESKTEASVSFTKSMEMQLPKKGEEMKMPFGMVYEMTMILAVTPELSKKEIKIEELSRIRTNFIKSWFENNRQDDYPNILFDWHKKLIDLDHFEAYNYWLLMKGNEKEFEFWMANNGPKWDAFIKWFTDNPMKIDDQNKFHRLQYN